MQSLKASGSSSPSVVVEALILFLVCFGPLAFGCVEPWSIAILEATCFLLLTAWFLRGRLITGLVTNRTVLPAFAAIIGLAAIQLANPRQLLGPRSLGPSSLAPHATQHALLLWLALGAVLWAVSQNVNSWNRVRRVAWTLFLLGGLVAVVGLIQKGQGNHSMYGLREIPYGEYSFFGPYYDRDHAGSMLSMSFLVGLGIFSGRFGSRPSSGAGAIADFVAVQVLIGMVLLLIGWGIVASGSRGALIACALGAATYGLIIAGRLAARRAAGWIRLTVGLLVLAVGAGIYSNPEAFRFTLHELSYSMAFRLQLYRDGLRLFRDFPLFGTGLGTFESIYPAYQSRSIHGIVEFLHSDWLQMATEVGAVGLAAFCLGIVGLGLATYRRCRAAGDARQFALLLGFVAAAIAFIFHGFIEFSFQIPGNAMLFVVILACIGGFPGSGESSSAGVHIPVNRVIAAVGASLAIGTACVAVVQARTPFAYHERQAYRSAAKKLAAAEDAPRDTASLRVALEESLRPWHERPLDPNFRYLTGAILWRLDRVADAQTLLP